MIPSSGPAVENRSRVEMTVSRGPSIIKVDFGNLLGMQLSGVKYTY